MSKPVPNAAILVIHKVDDFDSWKKVFDEHESTRKQASALGHDLHRGCDDGEMVYVYCPVRDVEKARAFADSEDLAKTMKAAGVVGQPVVKIMKPVSEDVVPEHEGAGLIVLHRVEDYAAWRKVYDEVDDLRKRHGIVGHAVNQEWGRPTRLIIYHQAGDRAALQEFVESDELAEAMRRGGVSGPPEFHFVESCEYAEY